MSCVIIAFDRKLQNLLLVSNTMVGQAYLVLWFRIFTHFFFIISLRKKKYEKLLSFFRVRNFTVLVLHVGNTCYAPCLERKSGLHKTNPCKVRSTPSRMRVSARKTSASYGAVLEGISTNSCFSKHKYYIYIFQCNVQKLLILSVFQNYLQHMWHNACIPPYIYNTYDKLPIIQCNIYKSFSIHVLLLRKWTLWQLLFCERLKE
jgi:hypothetical protein